MMETKQVLVVDDVPNDNMHVPDNFSAGVENNADNGINFDWNMDIDIGSNFQFPPMPTPATAGKQKEPHQTHDDIREDDIELPPPLQTGRAVQETEQMAQIQRQVVERAKDDEFVRPRTPRKRQRTTDSVISTVTSSIREASRKFVDGVRNALRRGPPGRSLEATLESARRAAAATPDRYNAFASAASSPLTELPPTPAAEILPLTEVPPPAPVPFNMPRRLGTPAARRFVYPKRPVDCVTDTATSVGGSIWAPETPLEERRKRGAGFAPRRKAVRDDDTEAGDMEPVERSPYPQRSRRRIV